MMLLMAAGLRELVFFMKNDVLIFHFKYLIFVSMRFAHFYNLFLFTFYIAFFELGFDWDFFLGQFIKVNVHMSEK